MGDDKKTVNGREPLYTGVQKLPKPETPRPSDSNKK